ncbi:glucose dehydrogenase [FAD, quinone]-like [Oppia nitens]|uniref:glucose dehydrogenase [FAD, quinone]-like n=1 Tax=Oppia nitens TaxID=1686743 RepID=UPI0023DA0A3D|nr:glucose dehydrogenase [FAD, quinone]-like [Oppia nitens]
MSSPHFTEQLLHISQSLATALLASGSSLKLLPLIPAFLYILLKTQLQHELYVQRMVTLDEYDYVVIGAGTAGSIMAARLSEDPHVSVLLLEAGKSETVVSDVPVNSFNLQLTPMDWSFATVPQKHSCLGLNGHRSLWPRGRVMGGTSTINTMVYCRGNPRDFDQWAANGARGWSWPEVFPYFIKSEDNRNPEYVASGYHGVGGPMTVTSLNNPRIMSSVFVNSGPHIGYPVGDINGHQQTQWTIPQINTRDGMRLSVAKAYLEPLAGRKNLHILTKAYVTKILIHSSDKRAVGVEFERLFKRYVVRARKEVILSAGSINSPKILMLSGIGPKEHLKTLGIPVMANLRVGDNLQEHVSSGLFFTVNETIGIDWLRESKPGYVMEYFLFRKNHLAKNIDEGTGFIKTKYQYPLDDWPDIQLFMMPGSLTTDYGLNFQRILGLKKSVWKQVFKPYVGYNTFSIYAVVMRPKSRGWIRLLSTDPYDQPLIDPKYFDEEQDLNVLVEGLKAALETSSSPWMQRYNARPFQTVYPGCEPYQLYSDDYLRCMARTLTTIGWHPSGTCKMGAKHDRQAVVDSQLRVFGINGLRVVDASVMPTVPTGNINAATIMLAEKIADNMRGRRVQPFLPPMTADMIKQLPNLPYEEWDENLV